MIRLIPQSLVIVYASKKYNHRDKLAWQGGMGMLVSSFNSVAVDPTPFVSFHLQLPSRTFDQIRRTSFFTAVAVSNAKVADAFTGHQEDRQAIFDNLVNSESPESASQGLLWWMRCEVVHKKSMTVRDRVIVVGQVTRSGPLKGWQGQEALICSRGTYRLADAPITPEDDARRTARSFRNQRIRNQRTANTPVQNLEVKDSESEEDNRQLQTSLMIKYYKDTSVRKINTGSSSSEWESVLSQELPNCNHQESLLSSDIESQNDQKSWLNLNIESLNQIIWSSFLHWETVLSQEFPIYHDQENLLSSDVESQNDQGNWLNLNVESLNEIIWSPSLHWGIVLSQELPIYHDQEDSLSSDVESQDGALQTAFSIPWESRRQFNKTTKRRRRYRKRGTKELVQWRKEREKVKDRVLQEKAREEELATKYQYLNTFETWQSSYIDSLNPYD